MVANPLILIGDKQKIASCESRFFCDDSSIPQFVNGEEPWWHTRTDGQMSVLDAKYCTAIQPRIAPTGQHLR